MFAQSCSVFKYQIHAELMLTVEKVVVEANIEQTTTYGTIRYCWIINLLVLALVTELKVRTNIFLFELQKSLEC